MANNRAANNLEPILIQGGMGVAVSGWLLARAVALTGQLGVVSGTALDVVFARRLQLGDPGGHMRRAMNAFPFPEMIQKILDRYFIAGGKSAHEPFIASPVGSAQPSQDHLELVVVSNFVEVYLAKENHDGLVGINYLEKIQLPTLPAIFGAMLAGVAYVLMGAGIPRAIPGVLDHLRDGEPVELSLNVAGSDRNDKFVTRFDPVAFTHGQLPWLERPKFLAIVSSATLATMLARKASGQVDGFVVEGPMAGGHNAPPRGAIQLSARGEPIYGQRDVPDLKAIGSLGAPFWLAGSYGTPEKVAEAIDRGATGVQVGTAFAFCEESGLRSDIKRDVLDLSRQDAANVLTDPIASPAGFPFKVLSLSGSMSDESVCHHRERKCDLGYLRHAYKRADGSIGWRCPAEDVEAYVRKGGNEADTRGRKCICNGLMANVGFAQIQRNGKPERPLVTTGDDVCNITRYLPTPGATSYTASAVVEYLLSDVESTGLNKTRCVR